MDKENFKKLISDYQSSLMERPLEKKNKYQNSVKEFIKVISFLRNLKVMNLKGKGIRIRYSAQFVEF